MMRLINALLKQTKSEEQIRCKINKKYTNNIQTFLNKIWTYRVSLSFLLTSFCISKRIIAKQLSPVFLIAQNLV